jgi:peptide/nickel transport system permease protein
MANVAVQPQTRRKSAKTQRVREVLDVMTYAVRQKPLSGVGFILVGLMVVLAVISPWIAPYAPEEANPLAYLQPPSSSHWFGTDSSGMDIFSRVIVAPRVDITIGVCATSLALIIGAPLGVISGFVGGIVAEVISRTADILQSFPVFILAMALVAVTGPSILTIIVVLAFLTSPIYLRLMRTQTYALREAPFVEAANVVGNSKLRIVIRHILPLAVPPAICQLSVNVGFAILITAGLSFVGAGVRVPTPEWGSMISVGSTTIITGQWWTTLFPGLAIVVTVLGFSLVGDAVGIILDPRQR